ncbi:unnamed protein product, partial [marine sediment metagenome]
MSGIKQTEALIKIDLEGIQRRIHEIPAIAGNYSGLSVNSKALFWVERGAGYGDPAKLVSLKIASEDLKIETVLEGIRRYELSADGKKILAQKGDSIYVFEAAPKKLSNLNKNKVNLSGWSFSIDVTDDFRQLFIDAWRLERDYFYDPGMHGLDWDVVLNKYLSLVDRITSRRELNDLIGQLVG